MRPAELDIAGLQRIAIPDFQGPAPYADQARGELSAAIARSRPCDLPPPHVVREMIPATVPYRGQPIDIRLVVEQARHAGFDAVLIGEVVRETNAGSQITFGNPWIETRIETQLIDVRSGHVRGETKAQRRWRGELSRHENSPNTERKVTEKLVRQCVNEAAGKLATQTVNIDVALAKAGTGDDDEAMQSGHAAAAEGNWWLAAQHFEKAKNANPTSHAAMYNLGLACEAQYQFAAAKHWHSEALRLHEDANYRAALTRVDASWRDYDLAMRQTQPLSRTPVMQASSQAPRW